MIYIKLERYKDHTILEGEQAFDDDLGCYLVEAPDGTYLNDEVPFGTLEDAYEAIDKRMKGESHAMPIP